MASANGKSTFLPSTPGMDGTRSFLAFDELSSSPRTPAQAGSATSSSPALDGRAQVSGKLSLAPASPSAGRGGAPQPAPGGPSNRSLVRDEELWETVDTESPLMGSTDSSGASDVPAQDGQPAWDSWNPRNPRASAHGKLKALERPAPNSRGSRLGALLGKSGAVPTPPREPSAAFEREAFPVAAQSRDSERPARAQAGSSSSPSTSSDGENVFKYALRTERGPESRAVAEQSGTASAATGRQLSKSSPVSPSPSSTVATEKPPSQTSPNVSAAADTLEPRVRTGSVAAMAARWGGSSLKEAHTSQSKGAAPVPAPPPRPERSPREPGRLGSAFALSKSPRSAKSRSRSRDRDQNESARGPASRASPPSPTRPRPDNKGRSDSKLWRKVSNITRIPDQAIPNSASVSPGGSPNEGLGISSPRRALNRTASHGDLMSPSIDDVYTGNTPTHLANGDVSTSSAGDVISPGAAYKAQALYGGQGNASASLTSNDSSTISSTGRGRLSRLQYNKPDRISIIGDRSWDLPSQRGASAAEGSDISGPPATRREGAKPQDLGRLDNAHSNRFEGSAINQDGPLPALSSHHRQTQSVSSAPRSSHNEQRLSTAPHRELLLPALTSVRSAEATYNLSRHASTEYGATHEPKSSAANVLAHAREDLQLANGSGLDADDEASPSTTGTTSASRHGRWSQRSHNTSMGGSSDAGSLTSPGTSIGGHRLSQNARYSGHTSGNAAGSVRPTGSAAAAPVDESQPPPTPGLSDVGSPRFGMLSDADIAEMGTVPGVSPASLLNANGAPLSSKSVLTIALQKAQSAVVMDSDNNVPEAIAAYKQAVRLLQEVMDRIAPNRPRKNKSSREEERRRLRVIHDTYAERIRLLSLLYEPDEEIASASTEDGDSSPQRSADVQVPKQSPPTNWSRGTIQSSLAFPRQPESEAADAHFRADTRPLEGATGSNDFKRDVARSSLTTPSISVQAEQVQRNRSRDLTWDSLDDQEVLAENGHRLPRSNAGDHEAHRDRSDSESSFRSAVGTGPGLPSGALRVPDVTRASTALSVGLEEEFKTPTTPYFDVDPNLSIDDLRSAGTPARSSLDDSSRPGRSSESRRVHEHQSNMGTRATGSLSGVSQRLTVERPLRSHGTTMERRSSSESNALAAVNAAAADMGSAISTPRTSGAHRLDLAQSTADAASRQTGPNASAAKGTMNGAASSPNQPRLLVSPSVSRGTISQRRQKVPHFLDVMPAARAPSPGSNASLSGNSLLATPTMEALTFFDAQRTGSEKSSSSPRMERTSAGPHGSFVPSPPHSGGQLDSAGRKRAASQPGNRRPPLPAQFLPSNGEGAPPMPRISRKSSMPGSPAGPLTPGAAATGLRVYASTNAAQAAATQRLHPMPRAVSAGRSPSSSDRAGQAHSNSQASAMSFVFPTGLHSASRGHPSFASGIKVTILPWLGVGGGPAESSIAPPVPFDPSLRPFHLMRQLHLSIVKGAFVTRKLYVPKELWAQQGAKLSSLESKIRVLLLVTSAVQGLETAGEALLQPVGDEPGLLVAQGAYFGKQLEEFEALLVEAQNNVAKKLSYIDAMAGKKTSGLGSFGSKLTRGLDRMTNGGKGVDSPATYVDALSRTFSRSQVLGAHLVAILRAEGRTGLAPTPAASGSEAYAALPAELRAIIEAKLRRASDFYANVIIRIAVHDVHVLSER
ncbi:hypothetical protein IE81DRAFT_155303 [Ceraceosorus guamensis]|uniref:Uncharacterized protein n=1 Tax=Ceraceosorus guamensis TaxID=1522189 RepID=A0A316VWJ8_9BASI|nr:hypothetical protein IE81DRAFT_155303 [Ceraceosorus guamensis]PWN41819.1 hypothetical protein IE81DRAFT_155303 [Ceraceosorus guamensis]